MNTDKHRFKFTHLPNYPFTNSLHAARATDEAHGIQLCSAAGPADELFLIGLITFTRGQEKIGFEAMLTSVEFVVASLLKVERLVRAALHDAACLYYKNLVGLADGREP